MASAGAIRAGEAYVEAGLRDAMLRAGLQRASAYLRAWGSSLSTILGTAIAGGGGPLGIGGGLLGGIIGALRGPGGALIGSMVGASVGGLLDRTIGAGIRMALQGISSADAIGDLAERLQVSVTGLNDLAFAAKASDVSLEDLTTMLDTLVKTLGQKGIVSTNVLDDFGRIADQVAALGTVTEKSALAQEYFGRVTRKGLTLLSQGRAGIAALAAEHQRLGALKPIDFQRIGLADQALKRLAAIWDLFKQKAASALAPTIVGVLALAREFLGFELDVRSLGESIFKAFTRGAVAVAGFVDWLRHAWNWGVAVWGFLEKWVPTIAKIVGGLAALVVVMKVIRTATIAYQAALKALAAGQAVVLAFSGPKGWLILAGAAIAAAGAVAGIDKIFKDIKGQYDAAVGTIDVPDANSLAARVQEALNKAMQAFLNLPVNAPGPGPQLEGLTGGKPLEMTEAMLKGSREAENTVNKWHFGVGAASQAQKHLAHLAAIKQTQQQLLAAVQAIGNQIAGVPLAPIGP